MDSLEPALKKSRTCDPTTIPTSTTTTAEDGNGSDSGNDNVVLALQGLPSTGAPVMPAVLPSETDHLGGDPQLNSNSSSSSNAGDLECRRYNTAEGCPYGSSCRFKHGPTDDRKVGQQMPSGGKSKPCMKFFSTSGCPYGEECHFLHYVPGGINALCLAPLSDLVCSIPAKQQVEQTADSCVMLTGYKTRLCNRYNTPEGCRFGDKCHFALGESDVQLSNNAFPNGQTVITEPLMQTASMTYDNDTLMTVGNSASSSSTTLTSAVKYAEPTPLGVTVSTPYSTMSVMGTESSLATGPVIGTNVQVC